MSAIKIKIELFIRKILFNLATNIILNKFKEGVNPIYSSDNNEIIAYQFTFKNEKKYR